MTAYVTIPVAKVDNVLEVRTRRCASSHRWRPRRCGRSTRSSASRPRQADAGRATDERRERRPRGPARRRAASTAVVWKRLADGALEPVRIALGITDHTFTEVAGVLVGDLDAGRRLATAAVASKSSSPAGGPRR